MMFLKEYKIEAIIWKQEKTTFWEQNNFPWIKSKTAERLQNKGMISTVGLLDKENFPVSDLCTGFCSSWGFYKTVEKREGLFKWREYHDGSVLIGTNSFKKMPWSSLSQKFYEKNNT